MKKIFYVLSIVLTILSCKKEATKDYILFSGTILDATKKEFRLVKRGGGGNRINLKIADDGSFISDTIISGTGRYLFTDSRNSAELYFTDGGEYDLTAVSEKFRNTAKLTGTDPDASNYLMSKIGNIIRARGGYAEFNSLNESEFVEKQKTLNKNFVSYLDSFSNIPKEFEELEREELHYYNMLTLLNYESLHRRYTKQPDFKVSDDFLKKLEGIDYVKEDVYKRRGSYTKLVAAHFKAQAKEFSNNNNIDKYLAKLKVFGEIPNDFIKNSLLAAVHKDIVYTDRSEEYYNTFLSVSTSETNNEIITKKYNSIKKLVKGQPSPIFTDYVNHSRGTSSLIDFKGKYVYIDVWATWCGPCLAEVPSLKKVEKKYHGKNIEFVSISIDTESKFDAWRKMVTDKNLGGVQLLADKAWGSDFIGAYEISGIPRFILIDPKGNIISANAPRPSDSKLIKLFNELKI
ncbi:TlpA family protein disulfide reductase [Polaribacter sp. Hel1_85]|uniref:TlpA family protein disulfide reductase n=1 Tax=Polaribacter sp. Hel1_85 TaxID=1250005 RepID=UPI00052D1039|nr:TlpA disulfide reductase family protein [Polaribacter sp. Hel1_85]KGL58775.1 alkyl hydroperoxide reductase/ thiol specific antioxidant / mal allergen [Polaribacter sp. Hel1_85]